MAAVLTKIGKSAVLVEALDRVLSRVAGPEISRFFEAEHRAHGVDIRLNSVVSRIIETNDQASGVELADGEIISAEMIIVGIGIVPAVDQLLDAGALATDGINVDMQCRTSLPDVFAIGDCCNHKNKYS